MPLMKNIVLENLFQIRLLPRGQVVHFMRIPVAQAPKRAIGIHPVGGLEQISRTTGIHGLAEFMKINGDPFESLCHQFT